jgi:c-di-AMP phosphodiesterase-like protein
MGGGGHFDMAGAQIKSSDMNNVLRMLKDKIDEYMKNEQ